MSHLESPEAYIDELRELAKSLQTNPDAYFEEFKVDLPGKIIRRISHINGEVQQEADIPIGVQTDITGEHADDGRPYKVKLLQRNFLNTKHFISLMGSWLGKNL